MSSSNVENVAPNVLKKIYKELAELISNPPEGIKVLSNEDVSEIHAFIDGPAGTPYQNGSFRVKLSLGKSFPAETPKGFFLTKIFHPNVSRIGEICVNTLKRDWNENLGIKHILLVIKCLLIVPNPESALNEDAAKLLLEDYDEYYRRAKMITEIHAKRILSSSTDGDNKIHQSDYATINTINTNSFASSSSDSSSTNNKKSSNSSHNNEPLSKRQANNQNMKTNNGFQSKSTMLTSNKPDLTKRTLKRL